MRKFNFSQKNLNPCMQYEKSNSLKNSTDNIYIYIYIYIYNIYCIYPDIHFQPKAAICDQIKQLKEMYLKREGLKISLMQEKINIVIFRFHCNNAPK